MKMDLRKELKIVQTTGKMILGFRKSLKSIFQKKAKIVLVANNCPENLLIDLISASKVFNIPVIKTELSSIEFGALLNKPFSISVLSIIDEGESNILEALTEIERRA
ncbi:MAG: 50S ribosomal protein L30e [Nitrososphaerota archaeon]